MRTALLQKIRFDRVWRRWLATAAAGATTILLTACGGGPYIAEVLVVGGAQLNPTFDKQPSAVNIRVLPLLDKAAFDNASDDDLYANPPNLAAGTWAPPHLEAVVYVGQKSFLPIEIKPTVRFLGVVGLFNEDTGQRRQVVPVGELADQKFVFDGFNVALAAREAGDAK